MNDTIRFTVSLPKYLLDEIDSDLQNRGYHNRSEYIRDLVRERAISNQWQQQDSEVTGVVTLVYDHHQRGLAQKLIEIQHDALIHVLCSTHVHIDHFHCLETIILKGHAAQLQHLVNSLGALKGVKLARLTETGTV
ncbi:nickel-responsive transcriptional regulator NikR [Shewanella sp. GXUN23E]|uniref:nickel-responsive transcriptional regulator NikR n=1 Tax=Shewanella sp. GXUN23E TaxID=3422498 RepID=UPI003D7D7C51